MSKELHMRELILLLIEDANNLEELVSSRSPSPSLIRSTIGPILRRWICDGDFNIVQKALRPNIIRFSARLVSSNEKFNLNSSLYGLWIGPISFSDVVLRLAVPTSEIAVLKPAGSSQINRMTSQRFFKQKVCLINGKIFTRLDILRFFANELGGTHFDYSKLTHDQAKQSLRNTVGYEVGQTGDIQMLMGAQITEAKADLQRRPAIYDLTDLIVLDTACIFARGITNNLEELRELAEKNPVTMM